MIVSAVVSVDVDLEEVYSICKPHERAKCTREITSFVKGQLDRRATDSDGGWMYPCSGVIAGHLIQVGMAEDIGQQDSEF